MVVGRLPLIICVLFYSNGSKEKNGIVPLWDGLQSTGRWRSSIVIQKPIPAILINNSLVIRKKGITFALSKTTKMNRKDTYGIYNNTTEHISLLKYSKSSCGVDFLLNSAESTEKRGWFDTDKRYRTEFFEFY